MELFGACRVAYDTPGSQTLVFSDETPRGRPFLGNSWMSWVNHLLKLTRRRQASTNVDRTSLKMGLRLSGAAAAATLTALAAYDT